MTEITLPCCDTATLVETLHRPIHCDGCGVDLEIADEDAPAITALAA
jgi:hypothetical protein